MAEHIFRSWRDRFIQLCIVYLGLLLAIGSERGVEALYRRHRRTELQAALRHDGERAVADSIQEEADCAARLRWLQTRLAQVDTAIQDGTALAPPPNFKFPGGNYPEDPIWKAAKSSGLQALLSQEDLDAYWELDYLFSLVDAASQKSSETGANRNQFQLEFIKPGAAISPASPVQLRQFRELLREDILAKANLRFDVWMVHGALTAILHGERNLVKIEEAEAQFMH